jgi:transposase-like protein
MKSLKQTSVETEPLVSGLQIARHYDVDAATVRRWRREGMPARYFSAKMVRYELSKVDEWLRAKGSQPRPVLIPPHERKKKEAAAK